MQFCGKREERKQLDLAGLVTNLLYTWGSHRNRHSNGYFMVVASHQQLQRRRKITRKRPSIINNNNNNDNNNDNDNNNNTAVDAVVSVAGGGTSTITFPRDPAHNFSPLKTYLQQNRNIKTLLAMAYGVVDPDQNGAFTATDIEPYYLLYKKKAEYKVNQSYYKLEIERCSKYNNNQDPNYKDYPCPTQWRKPTVLKWLDNHPIEDEHQIAWIFQAEKDYCGVIYAANNEALLLSQSSSLSASTRRPAWCPEKHMCLIHVSVEDNVWEAYTNWFAADTREELGAQSSANMQRFIPEQVIDEQP